MTAAAFLWLSLRFIRQPRRDTFSWAVGAWLLVLYSHKSGYFLAPLLPALVALRRDFASRERRFLTKALVLAGFGCLPLAATEISAAAYSQGTYANAGRLAPGITPWLYPFYSIYNLSPQTVFAERSLFELLRIGPRWTALAHAMYLIPAAIALAAWWRRRKGGEPDTNLRFLILWTFIPTVFMIVMSLSGMPVYLAGRNDLPLLRAMVLIPVHGLTAVQSPQLRASLIAAMVLSLVPYHLAVLVGVRPTLRGFDRANALEVSGAMKPEDSCLFIGHIYFSYDR